MLRGYRQWGGWRYYGWTHQADHRNFDGPAIWSEADCVHRFTLALEELEPEDRPVWATALFAGLRLGELQALLWSDVRLQEGLIRVERSWDRKAGPVAPKSRSGRRSVPVAPVLRRYLVEHRMRCSWRDGLVFGRRPDRPFDGSAVLARARRRWERVGLDAVTLHDARHTFASLMIAAGVNPKALSTYLAHASITITLDRYAKTDAGQRGRSRCDARFVLDPRSPGHSAAVTAGGLRRSRRIFPEGAPRVRSTRGWPPLRLQPALRAEVGRGRVSPKAVLVGSATTRTDLSSGLLICGIGVAPPGPAEFVIFGGQCSSAPSAATSRTSVWAGLSFPPM